MKLITLTTDFGLRDWFVGTMKGVILSINPRATIVDLTHEIAPGDIRGGAFALAAGYRFFPKGTVHVAVVDPGVGSERRAFAVQTADYTFIGPDNGVLSFALARETILSVRAIRNPTLFRMPVSQTFQGRDIFAPVAAFLSRNGSLGKVGPRVKNFIRLAWPSPRLLHRALRGEVVCVDRFGNAITNISAARVRSMRSAVLFVRNKRVCRLAEFYQAVPPGKPLALIGSSGLLEVAINGGSAADALGLKVGTPVTLHPDKRLSRMRDGARGAAKQS